jgi:hypothetical protein
MPGRSSRDLAAHDRAAGFTDFDEYERARDQAIDWLNRGVPLPDVISTTRPARSGGSLLSADGRGESAASSIMGCLMHAPH